jgi:hypothetical protein
MKMTLSSKFKKIAAGLLFLIGVYALAGFFLVPYIAKQQAIKNIEILYKSTPTIEKIFFNPFSFEIEITDFNLPSEKMDESSRLKFKRLYVNLDIFPLLKKEIFLKELYLDSGYCQFSVFKKGLSNWTPAPNSQSPKAQAADSKSSPWTLTLQKIQITASQFDFNDNTLLQPLRLAIEPINLTATNISTALGSETSLDRLSLSFGNKGHLDISGKLSLEPVSADINFSAGDLPLDAFTSYLSNKTYLEIQRGRIDLDGGVEYRTGHINFKGNAQVKDFTLIENKKNQNALIWKSLNLKKITAQSSPLSVNIGEIEIIKPQTDIALRKDGTLNFKDYLRPQTQPEKTQKQATNTTTKNSSGVATKKPSTLELHISRIQVSEGILNYADEQIRPHFMAHVDQLSGLIGPFDYNKSSKTKVALNGRVETFGKFKTSGTVVTQSDSPSADLDVHFSNIEMTTFSPYSGHFAGYEIKKGKLFLDLNYTLVNKKIVGKNHVLLDQFTLGNEVKSENSTNLPIKLALALMKDRNGQINFKLPIEGDVNSPSFSFGNLIRTALTNMIINIVSAPFDFIAGLAGGSNNLESIYFEPGVETLPADQIKKIQDVAKMIADRPNLIIEVQGQYEDNDAEIMKKKKFLGSDVSEDELRSLALKRGQLVQKELVANKIESERIYLLSAQKTETRGKPPRAKLTLKSN